MFEIVGNPAATAPGNPPIRPLICTFNARLYRYVLIVLIKLVKIGTTVNALMMALQRLTQHYNNVHIVVKQDSEYFIRSVNSKGRIT